MKSTNRHREVFCRFLCCLALISTLGGWRPEPLYSQTNSSDDDTCRVQGIVIDDSGEPVAGAVVYVMPWNRGGSDGTQPVASVECGMNGEYEISFRKSDRRRETAWHYTMIAAFADDHAPDWSRYGQIDDFGNHQFTLHKVDKALNGKILGPGGRPMEGAVVDIISIAKPDQLRPDGSLTLSDLNMWLDGDPLKEKFRSVSDQDGRVVFPNLGGQDRYYTILVHGSGIATEGHDINQLRHDGETEFDFIFNAQESQPVSGVVRNAKSGDPLEGVTIKCRYLGGFGLVDHPISTSTDAQGKFTINGLPMKGESVTVIPGPDQCFVPTLAKLIPGQPDASATEIELEPGVWITGQVTEKKQGTPIRCPVRFRPGNSTPAAIKFMRVYRRSYGGIDNWTDRQGKFRIIGVPGTGTVQVVTASPYPESLKKSVKISENEKSTHIDFVVDRGESVRIRVLDDQGEPAHRVAIQGMRSASSDWGSTLNFEFRATGFAQNEERIMMFFNNERHLGIVQIVSVNSKQPVTVKMQAMSMIKGRLVNERGEPIARAQVNFDIVDPKPMRRSLNWRGTDANGVFVQEYAVPGATYQLRARIPGVNDEPIIGMVETLQPAELVDFGDVDGKSSKPPKIRKRVPRRDE